MRGSQEDTQGSVWGQADPEAHNRSREDIARRPFGPDGPGHRLAAVNLAEAVYASSRKRGVPRVCEGCQGQVTKYSLGDATD